MAIRITGGRDIEKSLYTLVLTSQLKFDSGWTHVVETGLGNNNKKVAASYEPTTKALVICLACPGRSGCV